MSFPLCMAQISEGGDRVALTVWTNPGHGQIFELTPEQALELGADLMGVALALDRALKGWEQDLSEGPAPLASEVGGDHEG